MNVARFNWPIGITKFICQLHVKKAISESEMRNYSGWYKSTESVVGLANLGGNPYRRNTQFAVLPYLKSSMLTALGPSTIPLGAQR